MDPSYDFTPAMDEAMALAQQAANEDEVPVGAVVVQLSTGEIIGRGRDQKMLLRDPTAHAEIIAMRQAAALRGDWRLGGCALVVTLEPCPMCAGAAIMSRIDSIIYGAANPKFGATGSLVNLPSACRWNHTVTVQGGLMQPQCAELLTSYFRAKRRSPSPE